MRYKNKVELYPIYPQLNSIVCDVNCAKHPHDLVDLVYLPPNISDWNNFMCGEFSRYGTLCGKCNVENNYYPRAYSLE